MDRVQTNRQDRLTWIATAHEVRSPLTRIWHHSDSSAFSIDCQFISMLAAYRSSGGIARCYELETRLAARLPVNRRGLLSWLHSGIQASSCHCFSSSRRR